MGRGSSRSREPQTQTLTPLRGRAWLNPEHRKAPGQHQEGWKPGVRGKLRKHHEETRRGLLLVCREVLPPGVRQRVVAVSWSAAKNPKKMELCHGVWRKNPRRGGLEEVAQGFLPKHRRARPPPEARSAFPSREREAASCLA